MKFPIDIVFHHLYIFNNNQNSLHNMPILVNNQSSLHTILNMSTMVRVPLTSICFSVILPITLFILALIKYQTKSNKSSKMLRLPPGPRPWPILGSVPEMLMNKPAFRWVHKLMEEMNSEIICIRLGDTHVISVSSPEIAREFLKQQDHVFSSRPVCLSAEILSEGYLSTAVTPYGEQWKKMRRVLTSEVVSMARHRWLQGKRDEESDHLLRYMYNKCKTTNGIVNIRTVAQHYCGNLTRKMLFGKRFFGKGAEDGGPGPEEEEHVKGAFTALQYLYSFSISDFFPFLRGYLDLDSHEKIMREACESVRKYHDPIIDERIKQWRYGEKIEPDDILDVLVMLKDSNGDPVLRSEEIKAQLIEIMLAAVDNPSNAVEWALAEMLNQPKTLEIAVEELVRVVGDSRLVQESDIPQLNYIKACLREAYRLHPVNQFSIPHVSHCDTVVAGYFIPKGSHLFLSRPGLGRNPRVWHEPLRFMPDRHMDDGDVMISDPELRVLSFSTGRRGCVAGTLGTTMSVMLLARLIHGFSFSFPPGVTKIELKESPDTMELNEPLVVAAKQRLDENLLLAL